MPGPLRHALAGRRARAVEHRRLVEADRRTAMLGRLAAVQGVLQEAETVIARGWVQCAWFAGGGEGGPSAACLVGAIVQASGGDRDAERTQKAIAVAWSTMLGRDDDPDTCTPPAIRIARVRELTAWNDAPGRTSAEVRALLVAGVARVGAARQRLLVTSVSA